MHTVIQNSNIHSNTYILQIINLSNSRKCVVNDLLLHCCRVLLLHTCTDFCDLQRRAENKMEFITFTEC